jgi:urease subunit beta
MMAKPLASIGGLVLAATPVAFNQDKPAVSLKVRNTGDRPIQVGSHFHFFEANRALEFDRALAYGMHLNIASSTAIRFEPGDERTVSLVPYGGKRRVCGFNNLVDGAVLDAEKPAAVERARARGFKST